MWYTLCVVYTLCGIRSVWYTLFVELRRRSSSYSETCGNTLIYGSSAPFHQVRDHKDLTSPRWKTIQYQFITYPPPTLKSNKVNFSRVGVWWRGTAAWATVTEPQCECMTAGISSRHTNRVPCVARSTAEPRHLLAPRQSTARLSWSCAAAGLDTQRHSHQPIKRSCVLNHFIY